MSYCQKLGIDLANTFSIGIDIPNAEKLNNGSVIELFQFGKSKQKEYLKIVQRLGEITKTSNINKEACLSKIHRLIAADKKLRGLKKDEFRLKDFVIPLYGEKPLQTPVSESEGQKPLQNPIGESESIVLSNPNTAGISKLSEQLKERRQKVGELTEKNKQLKRKLQRKEKKLEETENKFKKQKITESDRAKKSFERRLQSNSEHLSKAKARSKDLYQTVIKSNRQVRILSQTLKEREHQVEALQEKVCDLQEKTDNAVAEKCSIEEKYKELTLSNEYLQDLIQDKADLLVYDHDTNTFSPELVECAMNLTDLKVATRNVGPVIREVASLCGKIPNRLPTRTAVDNFVDRKIIVSQKHVGSVAARAKETTLYTDETRKDTVPLSDISAYCEEQEGDTQVTVGHQLLANIANTMSDRASTEKNFNNLLQQYKNEILPDVVLNFNNLEPAEQELCGQINNFFCGLHLLIAIADVTEASVRKFEEEYLDGKEVGSAQRPELKRYHKKESGTLRLLRTSSKAFAMGEDERNGVYLPWKTYLSSKGEKKNYIQRFKHNRFNMIFMVGQAVFYHHEDIHHFLANVHGTQNDLLKAVMLDSVEPLFLAGAKLLGLISKFITAPLWRLIESPGHILDMNLNYQTLYSFLDRAAVQQDVASNFLSGEASPFTMQSDENDKILTALTTGSESLNPICLPLLQNVFAALKDLLKRMIPEHLPGGKYWDPSPDIREKAASARKHNKSPEFIFGQLDHLTSFRPNASVLANEAYLLYAYNKTSEWLRSLPIKERDKIIEESRKGGREVRKKFKERLHIIEEKRIEAQQRKQQELQRLEKERLRKAEMMTNDICYYGLWQTAEQVDEGIARMDTQKDVISALHAQLKFRKNVLKQKHTNNKIFNLSRKTAEGKYEKLSVDELKSNILELITSAARVPTSEVQHSDMPLLVGKVIDHKFTDKSYRGKVISVVPGFPSWYNVKYDGDDAIYAFNLMDDYKKGDLSIVV
ncbi:hypothetical protein FSP39_012735 [Pinctada imbricata]|uniref:Uncharacterized protein n=1 Tax=Pinctada imbricata TaxID=66713 RepID=A0AA88YKH9_PINIB|nr:hypothetical protein FSP39_012735 [Pinctada imbricata]